MKKFFVGLILALFLQVSNAETVTIDPKCEIYFSPKGGATEAIVKLIESANKSIYVMAYSFTSNPIADALLAKNSQGIPVYITVDRTQPNARGGDARRLAEAGIKVYVDDSHRIQHNKFMVVDEKYFETGSFNYSASAESNNAENIIICPSSSAANVYIKYFLEHKEHTLELNNTNFPPKQ